MKYGAWDINHLKILTQQRYLHGLIASLRIHTVATITIDSSLLVTPT